MHALPPSPVVPPLVWQVQNTNPSLKRPQINAERLGDENPHDRPYSLEELENSQIIKSLLPHIPENELEGYKPSTLYPTLFDSNVASLKLFVNPLKKIPNSKNLTGDRYQGQMNFETPEGRKFSINVLLLGTPGGKTPDLQYQEIVTTNQQSLSSPLFRAILLNTRDIPESNITIVNLDDKTLTLDEKTLNLLTFMRQQESPAANFISIKTILIAEPYSSNILIKDHKENDCKMLSLQQLVVHEAIHNLVRGFVKVGFPQTNANFLEEIEKQEQETLYNEIITEAITLEVFKQVGHRGYVHRSYWVDDSCLLSAFSKSNLENHRMPPPPKAPLSQEALKNIQKEYLSFLDDLKNAKNDLSEKPEEKQASQEVNQSIWESIIKRLSEHPDDLKNFEKTVAASETETFTSLIKAVKSYQLTGTIPPLPEDIQSQKTEVHVIAGVPVELGTLKTMQAFYANLQR